MMSLGLILIEFNDAIREGDGDRICKCWQFFLPIFKSTRQKNYAIEAFTLLAQLNFLFAPRMATQLKWSHTINTHGRPGKNISCDLHMEHLNRLCKGAITGLGSNVTDNAVLRIGKCLGELSKVTDSYDTENEVPVESGFHTGKSNKQDLEKMLNQLNEMKVFDLEKSTNHSHSPIKPSPVTQEEKTRGVDEKQNEETTVVMSSLSLLSLFMKNV